MTKYDVSRKTALWPWSTSFLHYCYLPALTLSCSGSVHMMGRKNQKLWALVNVAPSAAELWQLHSSFNKKKADKLSPKVGWEISLWITWRLPILLYHVVPFQNICLLPNNVRDVYRREELLILSHFLRQRKFSNIITGCDDNTRIGCFFFSIYKYIWIPVLNFILRSLYTFRW